MNESRFNGKASIYAKYRPSYPNDFITYLYSDVGLTKSSVIADIGSGTGILTKLLLQQGSVVYGVEPNDEMRRTARKELSDYQNFISVNATAENTGLRDSSVDFITAAQAFHWFDGLKFRLECRRILKSNGKVILVWNSKDITNELVKEVVGITREFCPDFNGFSVGLSHQTPEDFADFFRNGSYEEKAFSNDMLLDEDSFIGGSLTASYAPTEGSVNYQPYISALRRFFAQHSRAGRLLMPNYTRSYVGTV